MGERVPALRLRLAAVAVAGAGISLLVVRAQGPATPEPSATTLNVTNPAPANPFSTNAAPNALTSGSPGVTITAAASTNAPPVSTLTGTNAAPANPFLTNIPAAKTGFPETNGVPVVVTEPTTNAAPSMADIRPVPSAVLESHPELATVSPIKQNANDARALDLQACFQMTAIRDDSLKISMHDIYIAQAQLSQSLSALWPTFTANNQQAFQHYNRTSVRTFTIPIIGGSISQGSDRNYSSASHVTMNYTVFNGLQNWNGLAASDAAIQARKETLARDYQTIYQSVAQAFYNVLQFQGDMVVQSDLIDGLKARVVDLGDRVKLGRSRPSELLQAQTDLANAKVTYEQQRGSLKTSEETLAFYIGIPAGNFTLKDSQRFPTASQLEFYVMQSGARPDILAQLSSLRQSERMADVAMGQMFPTITATGDYLSSQDPNTNPVDATMIIEASMPIFDGGLILGQIHEQKELVRQSRLNVEQLRRTADQDTRTAYASFNSSAAQVIVLREAAVLAAKNLEAQVDDYRKGVVSNLDVLTALEDYQAARQGLHNSNMQARFDLISLHVAAGMAARGPNANNQALPKSGTTAKTP